MRLTGGVVELKIGPISVLRRPGGRATMISSVIAKHGTYAVNWYDRVRHGFVRASWAERGHTQQEEQVHIENKRRRGRGKRHMTIAPEDLYRKIRTCGGSFRSSVLNVACARCNCPGSSSLPPDPVPSLASPPPLSKPTPTGGPIASTVWIKSLYVTKEVLPSMDTTISLTLAPAFAAGPPWVTGVWVSERATGRKNVFTRKGSDTKKGRDCTRCVAYLCRV